MLNLTTWLKFVRASLLICIFDKMNKCIIILSLLLVSLSTIICANDNNNKTSKETWVKRKWGYW